MTNLEVIQELYGNFARAHVAGIMAVIDKNVEWILAEKHPYGGVYHGPDEVAQSVFFKIGTEWEDYHADVHDYHDAGATIIALGAYSGIYRKTGKRMKSPFAHVWTLSGGRIVKFVQYTDTMKIAEAL